MFYVAQIATVIFVIWASIYYRWDAGGPAVTFIAIMAAMIVTAILDEIQLLPSRFALMRKRLFGLKDEPGDEIPGLLTAFRHPRYTFKDRSGLRVGKDPRQLVEVAPELPLTVLVADDGPPFTRTEPRLDGLTDDPATGHSPKLLGIERGE